MNKLIVKTEQISRIYRQGEIEVHALREVDLNILAGEFSALAGPSGSGKTTLLNMIGCLDTPTKGNAFVNEVNVTKLTQSESAKFRLNNIGFVFQSYNLIPVLSAYENAEFVMMLQGIPLTERKKTVMDLLDRVGLADAKDRRPHQLSGGQQQRVAVVRAIASRPSIILADEPTANLDSDTSANLLDLMQELNESEGTTFLFSTHDPLVMSRARRVIRLDSGQIIGEDIHHDGQAA